MVYAGRGRFPGQLLQYQRHWPAMSITTAIWIFCRREQCSQQVWINPGELFFHQRRHRAVFTDIAQQRVAACPEAGMVTSASWADVDGDRRPDLVVGR